MTRREREVTDINDILQIINETKILHLGLSDEGWPYVVPMNYGYEYVDGKLTFYLHGATKGYKFDVLEKNPKVSFALETDMIPFEGKVACQYGMAYRSVMGRWIWNPGGGCGRKRKSTVPVDETADGKGLYL